LGSPQLIVQWLDNIRNPSAQNTFYWSINNVSLTSEYSVPGALLILASVSLILALLVRLRIVHWTRDHTLSSLLFASMFVSPYASLQSVSAALAFVPSWSADFIYFAGLVIGVSYLGLLQRIPVFVLFFAFMSIALFNPRTSRDSP
jgi:hypothetical protein